VGDRVLVGLPPLEAPGLLGNPLKSEAAAFQWLLLVVVVVLVVTLVALALR
jgi:hypothetical protein